MFGNVLRRKWEKGRSIRKNFLKYILQDLGWWVRYHTITLGVTSTICNDCIACLRESAFTFCTRANCTIVGPYDVESYAWLGHAASAIR